MTIDSVALRELLETECHAANAAADSATNTSDRGFHKGTSYGLRFALAALREAEDRGVA